MNKKNTIRLDLLLIQKAMVASRQKAQALILAKKIKVNGQIVTKASTTVELDCDVEMVELDHPYVSRGGVKLEGALTYFNIDVRQMVVLDAGASSGGFTDCLLQRGAKKVYAFDVGYGQIDWKLRNDPRVIIKEKFNIRYLTQNDVDEKVDLVVGDLSFISLTKVIPAFLNVLKDNALLLLLVKPQFELERQYVGKGGVVKNDEHRLMAVKKVIDFSIESGLNSEGYVDSKLAGPKGNREIFVLLKKL